MATIRKVSPAEAREREQSGEALLVCAYENEELCRRNRLGGALSLQEFSSRLPSLPRTGELIFYCA